jgi:hypothetical protein
MTEVRTVFTPAEVRMEIEIVKLQIAQQRLRKAQSEANLMFMASRPSHYMAVNMEHNGVDWVCSHTSGLSGYGSCPENATLEFDKQWYGVKAAQLIEAEEETGLEGGLVS